MENLNKAQLLDKNMCIFCLDFKNGQPENSNELMPRFLKLVRRHFKEKIKSSSNKADRGIASAEINLKLDSCTKCSIVMNLYCQVYHAMKCLELQLNYLMDKLSCVIKCADANDLRIDDFRDWCMKKKLDMDKSMAFRKSFYSQSKLLNEFPRVSLHRLPEPEVVKPAQPSRAELENINPQVAPAVQSKIEPPSPSKHNMSAKLNKISSILEHVPESPESISISDVFLLKSSVKCDLLDPFSNSPISSFPAIQTDSSDTSSFSSLENEIYSSEPPLKKIKTEPISVNRDCDESTLDPFLSTNSRNNPTSNEPSPTKRKIRQIFQCTACKATFSASSNLENHLLTNHSLTAKASDKIAETCSLPSDHDSDDDGDINDPADEDWAVNSDVEDDDDEATEDAETVEKSNTTILNLNSKLKCSQIVKAHMKEDASASVQQQINGTQELIKCEKCNEPRPVFSSMDQLDAHNDYKHTNGQAQIFKKHLDLDPNLNELHIKLQGIPIQEHCCTKTKSKCTDKFLLPEELESHEKLHGRFKCKCCRNQTLYHLTDLVEHEIAVQNWDDKPNSIANANCRRCDYTCRRKSMLEHYLAQHFPELEKHYRKATCPICHKVFNDTDRVPVLHYINSHDISRLNDPSQIKYCRKKESCNAYFITDMKLQRHKKSQRCKGSIFHKCPHCSEAFPFQSQLNTHLVIHELDKDNFKLTPNGLTIEAFCNPKTFQFHCTANKEHCTMSFLTAKELESHVKLHQNIKCQFCDEQVDYAPNLALHELQHRILEQESTTSSKKSSNIQCPRCPVKSVGTQNYKNHHLEVHLGFEIDRKRCPVCGLIMPPHICKTVYKTKEWIYRHHMDYHNISGLDESKVYRCDLDSCEAYFRNCVQLHRHKVSRHWNGKEVCETCGKALSTLEKLNNHRKGVHKVKSEDFKHVCAECGKRYERDFELEYHFNFTHAHGFLQLICDICGRKCLGASALESHKTSHQEKVVKVPVLDKVCDQCGKGFVTHDRLKSHLIWHQDPATWKFSCKICSKKCPQQAKLREHMRTHTQEKPFVCKVCGTKYAHAHNLRIHVKNKHGGN